MATSKKTRFMVLFMAMLFLLATVGAGAAAIIGSRNNKAEEKKQSDALAKINEEAKKTTEAASKANQCPQKTGDNMKPVTQLPEVFTQSTAATELIKTDLVVGTGEEVLPGDCVTAFYHGTLLTTGATFDSSYDRGAPIQFPPSRVIKGWQDGVPGMKVGGQRRLVIPAALAYGAQSPSAAIPANSDLVFIIEITATKR
jgi:peptidylprolyl isomerase